MVMRVPDTISAAEFKAKCLDLMDRVASSGRSIVVTKRGKPIARLAPMEARPDTLFGYWKGQIEIRSDIVAPLGVRWRAR